AESPQCCRRNARWRRQSSALSQVGRDVVSWTAGRRFLMDICRGAKVKNTTVTVMSRSPRRQWHARPIVMAGEGGRERFATKFVQPMRHSNVSPSMVMFEETARPGAAVVVRPTV